MIDKLTLAIMGIHSPEPAAPAHDPAPPPAAYAPACPCVCEGCACKKAIPTKVVKEQVPPATRSADVPPYSVWVSNEGRYGLGWVMTNGTFRAAPGDAGPSVRPAPAPAPAVSPAAPVAGCRIVNGRKVCNR